MDEPPELTADEPQAPRGRSALRVLAIGATALLVAALIVGRLCLSLHRVPTGSMAPTLIGRHAAARCPSCAYGFLVGARVPAGSFFLLGDNVSSSFDSRHEGFIPEDRLRGRVVWTY